MSMTAAAVAPEGSIRTDPRSLLILRLSALGDVIHTLPAVIALRRQLPAARISWVVEAAYRELVELVAGVETIPVSMKRWGRQLFSSRAEMGVARLAMRGFETAIDFQGLVKSASLGFLSGAPSRYGFDAQAIREKPALLFTNRKVEVDRTQHVVDWNVKLASAAAGAFLAPAPLDFRRYLDPLPEREAPGEDGASHPIVLLPAAGRPEKQWPADRFRELARRLDGRVVVAWGPGEEGLARSVGAPLAPPTSLRQLASLLSRARLVVAGDTGPLHLAAALGTPVLGLYGPTSERRNGPYGQLERCISRHQSTMDMRSIEVNEVARRIEEILQ